MKPLILAAYLLFLPALAQAAPPPLTLSRVELSARADLGQARISYRITPASRSANVGAQIWVRREDVTAREQYDLIAPVRSDGAPLIFQLFKDLDNSGEFTVSLKKGRYGACRLVLFQSPDGKIIDYSQTVYDSAADARHPELKLGIRIETEQKRVVAPVLEVAELARISESGAGTYRAAVSGMVKLPAGFGIEGDGLWAMAKGSGLFSQVWVDLKKAQPGNDPRDSYRFVPVEFVLDGVKAGLWSVQFGLFKPSFGDALQWIHPGLDFEVGGDSWVVRAPSGRIPPRLRVRNRRFETLDGKPFDFYPDEPAARQAVSFVRGGNYGNAIAWTLRPELNTPGYFTLLGELGCRYIRVNFNADRYADEQAYQHALDQVVQNIWAAGLYPLICPQSLPTGGTREEQVEKGLRVVQAMARIYKGKSVWLELCNEPHEFGTWAEWKPVAVRYAKAIRSIDPDAFVVVPFEGYQKSGAGAAKDPIREAAVDLYDAHAYAGPDEIGSLYGPALAAGLPLLIGEYGGGDAAYLRSLHATFQRLPAGLMAAGPWAFTIAGQDSLPLIQDGSTAELKFTPAGQAVADSYRAWNAGKRIPD